MKKDNRSSRKSDKSKSNPKFDWRSIGNPIKPEYKISVKSRDQATESSSEFEVFIQDLLKTDKATILGITNERVIGKLNDLTHKKYLNQERKEFNFVFLHPEYLKEVKDQYGDDVDERKKRWKKSIEGAIELMEKTESKVKIYLNNGVLGFTFSMFHYDSVAERNQFRLIFNFPHGDYNTNPTFEFQANDGLYEKFESFVFDMFESMNPYSKTELIDLIGEIEE